MSTRAMIYIKYYEPEHPQFKGVYCGYDGYIDHVGKILQKYFITTKSVEDLIKGNIIEFNIDGTVEYAETSSEYDVKEFGYEDDFPKFIDYHYYWDTVEMKWYVCEWDHYNWRSLESVLNPVSLKERLIDEVKVLSLKTNLKINDESYIKTNDMIDIIKGILNG